MEREAPQARVPLAVVQRILGHSSPTITAGVYGHLDVDDMRASLEQLGFQPSEAPSPRCSRWPRGNPCLRVKADCVPPSSSQARTTCAASFVVIAPLTLRPLELLHYLG